MNKKKPQDITVSRGFFKLKLSTANLNTNNESNQKHVQAIRYTFLSESGFSGLNCGFHPVNPVNPDSGRRCVGHPTLAYSTIGTSIGVASVT